MEHGSSVVLQTRSREDRVQVHLLQLRFLPNFAHSTLPVSFGRYTRSRWSILPGVYAGEVKYFAQGVNMKPAEDSQSVGVFGVRDMVTGN